MTDNKPTAGRSGKDTVTGLDAGRAAAPRPDRAFHLFGDPDAHGDIGATARSLHQQGLFGARPDDEPLD